MGYPAYTQSHARSLLQRRDSAGMTTTAELQAQAATHSAYDNPRVRTQMRVDAQDNRYFTPLQKVNQSSPGGTNVKVQWRLNQNRRPGDLSPSTLQVSPNIRRKKMKDSTMQVHDMVKA